MEFIFKTYADFTDEYNRYNMDKCNKCKGTREVVEDKVIVIVENKKMNFEKLLLFQCTNCGEKCLPMHSKDMIDGCYKTMIEQNQIEGIFSWKGYRKKFNYCQAQEFLYDYRDY